MIFLNLLTALFLPITAGFLAESLENNCEVSFKMPNAADAVVANSDLTLICNAQCTSRPIGYNVTISHREVRLPLVNSYWQDLGSLWKFAAEIPLVNVSEQQDGPYSCLLTTPKYNTSRDLILSIKGPMAPIFLRPNAGLEFTLAPSESNETKSIVLDCLATGVPPPEYSWSHNGYYLNEAYGMGNWTVVLPSSESEFACLVNNSIGLLRRKFQIRKSIDKNADDRQIASWVFACIIALGILAAIVASFLFVLYLHRRNSYMPAKASMEQMFSENGLSDGNETMTKIEEPDVPPARSLSRSSRPASGETSTEAESQPIAIAIYEEEIEMIKNLPYKRDLIEIDVKVLKNRKLIRFGLFRADVSCVDDKGSPKVMPVAVKMVRNMFDLEQYISLATEIKLLSMVGRHLNIVSLVGAVTDRLPHGILYMVLEYCPGGCLLEFLRRHRDRFRASEKFDYFTSNRPDSLISSAEIGYVVSSGSSSTPCSIINPNHQNIPSDFDQARLLPALPGGWNGSAFRRIMQFPNSDDDDFVRREGLSTRDLEIFSYQIACGMAFLHEHHFLHGDVAARNVLVCNGNILKITDFGLSKVLSNYQEGRYIEKTHRPIPFKWMPPECFLENLFSPKTDVWSYGVLLWEIFTLGKTPYPEVDSYDESFIHKLETGSPLPPADYATETMSELMRSCWCRNPDERHDFRYLKGTIGEILPNEAVSYYSRLEAEMYSSTT